MIDYNSGLGFGFCASRTAALREFALRESPRTPRKACFPKNKAGQLEAATDLVVESPKSPGARIKPSKEKHRTWQRRPEAIQFLIGEPWRYL